MFLFMILPEFRQHWPLQAKLKFFASPEKCENQRYFDSRTTIVISLYLKAYIENLVQNGPVVSEKRKCQFSYVNDLGPRSRNDLDLQYLHTFINSISCLHLPAFRSYAAIVSEKSIVFTFSYRKP